MSGIFSSIKAVIVTTCSAITNTAQAIDNVALGANNASKALPLQGDLVRLEALGEHKQKTEELKSKYPDLFS